LTTTGIIPSCMTVWNCSLHPGLYILMQKAVILNTCHTVLKVFMRLMNKKCLVSGLYCLKTS
jgi:hypothetical protein